jgi:hypothetical protein
MLSSPLAKGLVFQSQADGVRQGLGVSGINQQPVHAWQDPLSQ